MPAIAGTSALQLTDSADYILYQQADWLVDPDDTYLPGQLLRAAEKFRPYSSFQQPMNPGKDAMWFRFTVNNDGDQAITAVLSARDSPSLSKMKLYWAEDGKQYSRRAQQRVQQHSAFYLSFTIEPGESRQLLGFWPAERAGNEIQSLRLQSETLYLKRIARHLGIAYLTLGIIYGLTIYNIFLYFFTREKSYIYYAMYVAFAGVFFSLHDELGYQLLPGSILSDETLAKVIWWSILPASLGLLLFSREFLETKSCLPATDKILRVSTVVYMVVIAIGFMINHEALRTFTIASSSILLIFLLVLGIMAWIKGQRQARLYVLSFLALFLALIVAGASILFDGQPKQITLILEMVRYSLILSLLLLSIALADRINRLKALQLKAEADASAAVEATRLKGKFLASMSHEIRTPINGVIGMAQIIRDNASNQQDRKTADILLSSADTLLNVVNDILDLSKIEAGKLRIDEKSFELGLLVANVAALFHELNDNPDLQFSVDIDGDLPDFILGDQLRLNQVLYNLLNNAFKFTDKGSVKLLCKRVGTMLDDCQLIRFSIVDTGIGINNADQQRLFVAYEQADQSSTRKYGGTGLGLSISRQLVELMGGSIGVNSEVGQGSEFWFTLNCKIDMNKKALLEQQRKQLQGKKIAIIYADAAYSKNEARCLQAIGAIPLLPPIDVATGNFHLDEADAVLTSDHMGEVLGSLIAACGKAGTPVIVARSTSGEFEQQWLQLGKVRQIYIPVTSIDIERALIELFEGKVLVRESKEGLPDDCQIIPANILVVEDNPTNQLIIKTLLDSLAQNITLVDNGLQALQTYREAPEKFDLILMDCEMPIMDGYESTRQIRHHELANSLPPIPICALTAHAMDENYQRCKDVGMNDVIIKPVKLEQLRYLIVSQVSTSPRHKPL